jgi:hypothetical protein
MNVAVTRTKRQRFFVRFIGEDTRALSNILGCECNATLDGDAVSPFITFLESCCSPSFIVIVASSMFI